MASQNIKDAADIYASSYEGVPVIGGIIGGVRSGIRQKKLERELSKMKDPRYNVSGGIISYYDKAVQELENPQGLSQESIALARQQAAQAATGNIRRARMIGGGNAGAAINAALNNYNVVSATNLGAQDAQMRQNNFNRYMQMFRDAVGQFQNIDNLNTGLDIQKQTALGRAAQDARLEKQAQFQRFGKELTETAGMIAGAMGGGAMGGGAGVGAGVSKSAPAAGQSTSGYTGRGAKYNYKSMYNPYTGSSGLSTPDYNYDY
jgi:hypothetical protein